MRVQLVRIGNSRGICIPRAILEQCHFGDAAELRVEKGRLIVTPDSRARHGWEDAFRAASHVEDDELLQDAWPANEFDREEWRW